MSLPFSTLWLQFLDKIIGDDDNEDDDERREDDEEADVQLALALSLSEAGRNVGESNQQFSEQQVRGESYEDQEELDIENQELLLLEMALSTLETEDIHNEVYVDQQSSQPVSPPQPDELERPQVISRCVICLDRQSEITFVPCGHLCSCILCSEHLGNSRCPLCRTNIESKLRIIHP